MTGDPVDAILALYGAPGPWQPLARTGVANRIYVTADVVLRVATDHADAVADARTESVAAPVARAAGVLTPRLIAFNDERTLIDRPFSLWERVHGETLGLVDLASHQRQSLWCEVGREIARLHTRVKACPDPNGYLDTPERDTRLDLILQCLIDRGYASAAAAAEIEDLIAELAPMSRPQLAPSVSFTMICTK
jgi:hypothetical protein